FVGFSILLAFIAASRHSSTIDTSLARRAPVTEAVPGGPPAPASGIDAAAAGAAGAAAAGNQVAPPSNGAVPLER
ncbi:MAG: preprotein translocase subunit SecG, partial [Sphingomonas sp.]